MHKLKVRVEDRTYEVTVVETGASARVTVEGRTFLVDAVGAADRSGDGMSAVPAPPPAAPVSPQPAPTAAAGAMQAAATGTTGAIHAPIPGVITKVCVTVGQKVERGAVVLKLEAMKMENDISSPFAGTVKAITVSAGVEVRDGQLLATIE